MLTKISRFLSLLLLHFTIKTATPQTKQGGSTKYTDLNMTTTEMHHQNITLPLPLITTSLDTPHTLLLTQACYLPTVAAPLRLTKYSPPAPSITTIPSSALSCHSCLHLIGLLPVHRTLHAPQLYSFQDPGSTTIPNVRFQFSPILAPASGVTAIQLHLPIQTSITTPDPNSWFRRYCIPSFNFY